MSPRTQDVIVAVMWSLLTVAVSLLAITHQSFWIDEGNSIFKAVMPSIGEMWGFAKIVRGSEIQMPLFMVSLWGWEKLVDNTEYALRAINIPLFIIAVLALRKFRFWPLVLLTSPFAWYYLGELRPYMFQIAGGAMGFAALLKLISPSPDDSDRTTGVHLLFFSALFLAASSLTAAVWSAGFVIAALVARADLLQQKKFWMKAGLWVAPALVLAGYYYYTLSNGYRGSVSRGGGLLTIGFGFYELMGLVGLGPGRSEIRATSPLKLMIGNPWLPLLALVLGGTWLLGARSLLANLPMRARIGLACAVIFPVTVFMAVSVIANFSVLGRHLSPLLPAFLIPIAVACQISLKERRWLPLTATCLTAFITSCVMIRTSERHARDDYRQATSEMIEDLKKGKSLSWQADMNSARFYAHRLGGAPYVHFVQTLESDPPSSLMFADAIYLNRPDIGYRNVDYRSEFRKEGFTLRKTLTGFEIWDGPGS